VLDRRVERAQRQGYPPERLSSPTTRGSPDTGQQEARAGDSLARASSVVTPPRALVGCRGRDDRALRPPESVPPPPVVVQRQLADAMPIIVWTHGPDGRTTYLNATWAEYTGASRAESLLRGVGTFVHPDDLPEVERRAREAREPGAEQAGFEASYRLRRHDGAYRWHIARVRPVHEGDGSAPVTTWVGTAMDVDDQRRAHDEQVFLASAAEVLGTSLDPARTLSDVARLVVPGLADWCAIDLLDDTGRLERVGVAHVDPSKVALAWEVWRRYPPQPADPLGPYAVLRARKPQLQREDPEAAIAEAVTDADLLALLRSLALKSWIIVPLVARDRALGTLTLVSAESGRRYEDRDVTFAAGVASRIAIAVDNARLYETATQLAAREGEARASAEAIAAAVVEQGRAVESALAKMRSERDAALARLADLERQRGAH
jgi:PAS domain S-box-containing protein